MKDKENQGEIEGEAEKEREGYGEIFGDDRKLGK